ncbi:hypothetical protein BDV26DRAFT_263615 [Aspergillus bertholletiae]|uniref:Uncharacterized protein n=1 Tax=Aspergillus bertholletiae TaxID=1226010 RepID=A0A5N7B791_9EURO|nr:hypothetical protein BDV26DRAFT_263615 [Aspergillus bertholletiae]
MRLHACEQRFYVIYCTFGYIIQVLTVYHYIQFSYVLRSLQSGCSWKALDSPDESL